MMGRRGINVSELSDTYANGLQLIMDLQPQTQYTIHHNLTLIYPKYTLTIPLPWGPAFPTSYCSSRSISRWLKIDHKAVLSHLRKVEFKKKLHVWVPHQLTPKNMMDRIFICEALAKRDEIGPFLKRMVTRDEKGVTYYSIVRKRSWSKCCDAAQTVAKP
ncbi:putative DD34D transposase [Trichonephila clavipes]|uniref:Putative DD34D transposase n=1 Tax=Trichonephila clavipes TaxID=2585209 RepID=A0A8X6R4D7_TRICX|nr:putative DD34D transposase [Trichonephila clavipes]